MTLENPNGVSNTGKSSTGGEKATAAGLCGPGYFGDFLFDFFFVRFTCGEGAVRNSLRSTSSRLGWGGVGGLVMAWAAWRDGYGASWTRLSYRSRQACGRSGGC